MVNLLYYYKKKKKKAKANGLCLQNASTIDGTYGLDFLPSIQVHRKWLLQVRLIDFFSFVFLCDKFFSKKNQSLTYHGLFIFRFTVNLFSLYLVEK